MPVCSARSTRAGCAARRPGCCAPGMLTSTAGFCNPRRERRQRPAAARRAAARTARRLSREARRTARLGVVLPRRRARVPLTLNNVNRNFRRFLWQARSRTAAADTGLVSTICATRWLWTTCDPGLRKARTSMRCCRSCKRTWALLDRRHRLLLAPDRGVLSGHQRPPAAGVRRHRPAGHRQSSSWRLTSRSACAAF